MAESSFRSRDSWPLWLWLFSLFLAGSLSLAFEAALGNRLAWIAFLIQLLLLLWASLTSPLEVDVDSEKLRVGTAIIERRFLGEVKPLSSAEMALLRGRDVDPRCWMAIRFWVATGVKIEICDHDDPTPYWLVSVKRAKELATALKQS